MKHILLIIMLCIFSLSFAQKRNKGAVGYFGIQYKPLIPFGLVGDKPFDLTEGNFSTTVSQKLGYSFGGSIRLAFTDRLGLETGILYTKRNYQFNFNLPDSNLTATNQFGFVNFDIPLNALVFIQLGKQVYSNVSLGVSATYSPSNIGAKTNINQHQFIQEGRRLSYFSAEMNTNVGFEYRTKKNGFFYLGIAGKIPFNDILLVASTYQYDTYKLTSVGSISGATFALDFKYFFHNTKNKGKQFESGPIEQ